MYFNQHMNPENALAEFIKKHREAAGLNHRQLAEAITAAGGKASTQAVQQWENTDPEQRTTRPSSVNRAAIAEVLNCDSIALEEAYVTARDAVPRVVRTTPRGITPSIIQFQAMRRQFEEQTVRGIIEELPEAAAYFQRTVALFDNARQFDYLSPNLAADWVYRSHPALNNLTNQIEEHLWRLLWLSRIDDGMGVKRDYLLALAVVLDPERTYPQDYLDQIQYQVERFERELQMLKIGIQIVAVKSPEELINCILAHENVPPLPPKEVGKYF
ncbi:helix-turn-helix transcriptional regulator [Burkholderia anthina]|uniref:Helix-turn-helix transcriptional regulator n=1 Tax=Burkholderia anthina TaxID=179879 RepID=A0A7T6VH27_9BURK|nr:helix-turn-helix transcriptional regulator [Burkholderia anthina]QQK03816.1 helix-turn-helix transcriptional regulator [Burkholderia anthina]